MRHLCTLLLITMAGALNYVSANDLHNDISFAFGPSFVALRSDYTIPAGIEAVMYNGAFGWNRHWNCGTLGVVADFSLETRKKICQFETETFWLWNLLKNTDSWAFGLGPSLSVHGIFCHLGDKKSLYRTIPYNQLDLQTGVRMAVMYMCRNFRFDVEGELPLLVMGHFVRSDNPLDPQMTSADDGKQILFWIMPNSFGGVWNYLHPEINISLAYTIAKSQRMDTMLFLQYSAQFLSYNFNGDQTLYLNHSVSIGCRFVF